MKKVLAIAPYSYLPYYSGGQKFIAQFLDWLGRETELTVISVKENDASMATSYRLLPLMKQSFSRYVDTSLIGKLTRLIQKEQFDTLICEHPYLAWLVFALRRRTGIRVIIHTHNIEYQRFRSTGRWWWPILRAYEKRCFKKADQLFFISPEEKEFAINTWHIDPGKCIDLPFGIEIKEWPNDKKEARDIIRQRYELLEDEQILLFTGLLSYGPNLDALKVILEKINPELQKQTNHSYRIIVCGKGLPSEFDELKAWTDQSVIYAGFADDISLYYKAADILLNPVQTGGGIKTKMVEAIAYGCTVVATESGARGIYREVCGEKLLVVTDNDWEGFITAIQSAHSNAVTPPEYYDRYYWGHLIKRIAAL